MDPLTLSAAAMGVGAITGLWGQTSANRANRREAQRNRNFQERMRNSQWQATVADMRAAGINPAVAYSQGPNAAPGGSQAAPMQNSAAAAMAAATQAAELRNINQSNKLLSEQTRGAKHDANIKQEQASYQRAFNKLMGMDERDGSLRISLAQEGGLLHRRLLAELDQMTASATSSRALAAQNKALARITGVGADFMETDVGRLVPLLSFLGGGAAQGGKILSTLRKGFRKR